MNSQIDSDGFQQVKRGPGPRGQRKQQQKSVYNDQNKTIGRDEAPRERLSFKDILFERNNLKKHEHSPKVDLWEEKDEQGSYYIIRMEIPGINKNKINIDIKENQIVLVTAIKSGDKPDSESVIYSECRYGKIIRRVKVPNQIYEEDIRTKYENGILKIELVQIPVEKTITKLDSRLDDEELSYTENEKNISIQVLYSTMAKTETTDQTEQIDPLVNQTGNWADDPVDPVESKSWAGM